MKKLLLVLIGFLLLLATAQVLLGFMGGIVGVMNKGEFYWFKNQALRKNDPGQCASIGNYLGQGNTEYLRERCLNDYTPHINGRSDCGKTELISKTPENLDLPNYYRESCLLDHFKHVLGNTLVENWLPAECTKLSEKLIMISYSLKELRTSIGTNSKTHTFAPLSETDRNLINRCESFLDTPRIYTFLRGERSAEEESAYIELQKKSKFTLQ